MQPAGTDLCRQDVRARLTHISNKKSQLLLTPVKRSKTHFKARLRVGEGFPPPGVVLLLYRLVLLFMAFECSTPATFGPPFPDLAYP